MCFFNMFTKISKNKLFQRFQNTVNNDRLLQGLLQNIVNNDVFYILKHNFLEGALGGSSRPFWCLFGCSLASLWDVLGSLWPALGTPWAHFGSLWSSWVSLGRPWGVFGPPFGSLWDHFGGLGGVLGCNFGHFGSFLMICC